MIRFPFVRRAILSKRSAAQGLAIAASVVGLATAIRWAVSDIIPHLTFVTYFPAVLIVSLIAGWRWGAAATLVSAFTATWLFANGGSLDFSLEAVASLAAFVFSAAIIVVTAATLRRSVGELEAANHTAEVLNRELQHRVGNTLAVVQAIASQTLRHSGADEFAAAFGGRLRNLAKAHDLMGRGGINRCSLRALVLEACKPFCDSPNLIVSGPECHLPSESCVPLMMCLHELCTNAAKHGSLSVPQGRITVTWMVDDRSRVILTWLEQGGPQVLPPARKGMGTGLLRMQTGIAEVKLTYAPAGLQCVIVIEDAQRDE
ncbi:MAG: HWE histidine kinase domain-containing protein [Alteraurantiacibacter sp.]